MMTSATPSAPAGASAMPSVTASSTSASSSSSSPCAACKFLRRKCQPDCVFAPYFPPDKPQKFVQVHKVFGASNVTKLLNELTPFQREDAVNSLAYEAETRLRDPVYGCVGIISVLQHQLRELQQELSRARLELSKYQAAATLGAAATVDVNHRIIFAGSGGAATEHFFLNPLAKDGHGHGQMIMMGSGSEAAATADVAARLAGHGGYDTGAAFGGALSMNVPTAAATGIGSLGVQFAKQWTVSGDERRPVGPP